MTLEEIRVLGLRALSEELGPVGMIQFLQQFETGYGDYTEERHEWLGHLSVRQIVQEIEKVERDV
ncbi:MAG: hypothetical protein JXA14_23815 [Anaerolineae bacterium]|nr:hypothetical protein [Anaerolineae bacterium]